MYNLYPDFLLKINYNFRNQLVMFLRNFWTVKTVKTAQGEMFENSLQKGKPYESNNVQKNL